MNIPRRLLDALAMRPWILVSFASGALLGVLIRVQYPLKLPDGVANVLGAALGSALAVGGAAWIATSKERARMIAMRRVALVVTRQLRDRMESYALRVIEFNQDNLNRDDVLATAESVIIEVDDVLERLEDFKPFFIEGGAKGILAYQEISLCCYGVKGLALAHKSVIETPKFELGASGLKPSAESVLAKVDLLMKAVDSLPGH